MRLVSGRQTPEGEVETSELLNMRGTELSLLVFCVLTAESAVNSNPPSALTWELRDQILFLYKKAFYTKWFFIVSHFKRGIWDISDNVFPLCPFSPNVVCS